MAETRSSLLRRVKDFADSPSWEEFDQIYRPLLVAYARARGLTAEAADEVAQECMAAVAEHIRTFERRASFRGWLRGMIDHMVADELKRRRREGPARTVDFARPQEREGNPQLLWERNWNRTHLLYCLNLIRNEISPVTFEAFELYVVRELPVREIARRLGITPNQLYVAKHRVMARLKARWEELADGLV